jgi:hypothetical protein
MLTELMGQPPDLCLCVEGDHSMLQDIKCRYTSNPLFVKVLENVKHHKTFEASNGLLYTRNHAGASVLCIPSVMQKKHHLTEIVIAQAHEVLGHYGPQKTADYICCHYWWP